MRPDRRGGEQGWWREPADAADPSALDAAGSDPARAIEADADLAGLIAELDAAGVRARTRTDVTPDPRFAADLRAGLLAGLPDATQGAIAAPARADSEGAIAASQVSASSRARSAGPWRPGPGNPHHEAPARLAPRILRRTPTVLPAPRWSILAVAALIVAAVGLKPGVLFPVPPNARVTDAAGATLVRDGATVTLAGGAALRAGDEIRVASDGHAALAIGAGITRLAGGTHLVIEILAGDRIVLDQLAGRAWHRVALDPGERYVVRTGDLTWTALGTAFDLDRATEGQGGEIIVVRSIQHDVAVSGPTFEATVGEGRRATVLLAAGVADLAMGGLEPDDLRDPWLLGNAVADRTLGLPLGVMTGMVPGETTPAPSVTARPTVTRTPQPPAIATPAPALTPTPSPAPAATARPTPRPTASPKPTPTAAPTLGTMGLTVLSCPGGVVLDWTAVSLPAFHRSTVLRNTVDSIPLAYPPKGGAVEPGTTSTKNAALTDGYDATVAAGTTYFYRAMALDASGAVISASPIASGTSSPTGSLGDLIVSSPGVGAVQLDWTAFAGPSSCFTYYKLVYSADDPTPSYLTGSPYLAAIGDPGVNAYTGALTPGTYWFRAQAVRTTSLGKFIVAETTPVQFTVP